MAHPSPPQLVAATPVTCVATPSSQEANVETHGLSLPMRRIGRYHLLQRIGAGGMGSVHLGLATGAAGFQRWIAIKQLNARFAEDASFVRRFRVEARISAAVIHPNVVQVLDVAEEDGELLLIMEYVHGVTVAQLQRDLLKHGKRLPVIAAVSLMLPVLHGLQAVHTACGPSGEPLRIVHRDISPQNIMVDASGHVRLLDFGVARATAQTQATGLGIVAGKLSYLAPEQAEGRFDSRSDLFAAGVVLWEALTGRRLFGCSENDAATLQRTLWRSIPPPSQLQPDIPPALDRVVLRALCRNAEQRYQTAHEFASALTAAYQPSAAGQLGGLVRFACDKRLRKKQALLEEARELTRSHEDAPADAQHEPAAHEGVVPGATQVSITTNKERVSASRPLIGAAAVGASLLCGLLWWGVSQPTLAPASNREARHEAAPSKAPSANAAAPTSMAKLLLEARSPSASTATAQAEHESRAPELAQPASRAEPERTPTRPRAEQAGPTQAARPAPSTERRPATPSRKRVLRTQAAQAPGPKKFPARAPTQQRKRGPASAAPSTVSNKPDCNPPTYLALDGIRHFKKGCL